MKKLSILLALLCFPLAAAKQDNILLYTDSVQVTSEISPYENVQADLPIKGTIMITHMGALKVDPKTFRMGDESLKVTFIKDVSLSSSENLVISIYEFELKGRKKGNYTLPPITVKVGDQEYQAPALDIYVDP